MKTFLFLFGYPGCGKNLIGDLLARYHGFYYFDLDKILVPKLHVILREERRVPNSTESVEMLRNTYGTLNELQEIHDRLVVSYPLVYQGERLDLKATYPSMHLVYIDVPEGVCKQRILERDHSLTKKELDIAFSLYEPLGITHLTLANTSAVAELEERVSALLNSIGLK